MWKLPPFITFMKYIYIYTYISNTIFNLILLLIVMWFMTRYYMSTQLIWHLTLHRIYYSCIMHDNYLTNKSNTFEFYCLIWNVRKWNNVKYNSYYQTTHIGFRVPGLSYFIGLYNCNFYSSFTNYCCLLSVDCQLLVTLVTSKTKNAVLK